MTAAELLSFHNPLHTLKILLIEDSVSDALLVERALMKTLNGNCHVTCASTLERALTLLGEQEFDVAMLDLSLPDSTEFDGLLSIQNIAPKLPVVILTAYADEEVALKAVEHGAQDYLFKDRADGPSMRRAMQYAIQRKQFESTLITQANFDTLTGLANRTLFESRLDIALARMRRSHMGIGLFFLDLNRFKQVNDTLGHAAGDKLLQQVAERLRKSVRAYDTAARFGGDEFALLIEGVEQARDCAIIAQKVITQIAAPFHIAGAEVDVDISIGIATCFADERHTREELMKQADEAMYGAKAALRSHYRFYTAEIQEGARARLRLEAELRTAFEEGEFRLHYQPKMNLETGKTTGLEALVRWHHPARGLLLPGDFMGVAEETGMAKKLGEWVFDGVCDDIARWQKAGITPVPVSVNLAPAQLDDPFLSAVSGGLLESHEVPPTLLAIEVPSSALLERTEERLNTITEIHKLGIAVHLDHFGTSAISLFSLQSLAVDFVKIAPALTREVNEHSGVLPLVQAIIDIAERFKVGVVASGIENDMQRDFFREQHCKEGQGFAICRPMPGEYMAEWLDKHKP